MGRPKKLTPRLKPMEKRAIRLKEMYAYLGGKCSECPATENLEFHHEGKKDIDLTIQWGRSWAVLTAEMDKCVLLCSDCHDTRHEAQHGSISKYAAGCSCPECTTASREYQRAYRAKKKIAHLQASAGTQSLTLSQTTSGSKYIPNPHTRPWNKVRAWSDTLRPATRRQPGEY